MTREAERMLAEDQILSQMKWNPYDKQVYCSLNHGKMNLSEQQAKVIQINTDPKLG